MYRYKGSDDMQKEEFTVRVRGLERRMYRIARTMLTCDQDMEDAVQNAILKAWEKRASLRENAFFETWLIRIMINECRAVYRMKQNRHEILDETSAVYNDDNRELVSAIRNLPEKLRLPLELHVIEGYSVKETARMLRAKEGTVKWRLMRARESIKNELEGDARL